MNLKCPCFTGTFISAVALLLSAMACAPVKKDSAPDANNTPAKGFNNDSAQLALLKEFEEEKAHPASTYIDTTLKPRRVDFSELLPVFTQNCMPCHSKGGNGPFLLTDYTTIRKHSAVIRDVMLERLMPPWLADNHYSALANAPAIADSTRWRIINWIDAGSEKAKKEVLQNQMLPTNELSRYPFQSYSTTQHTINSNTDSYQCFVIDLDLKTDTFVKFIKFHSTNTASIHHIMVYLDTAGVLNNSEKCWNCMKSDIVNKLVSIDSWSRGMTPCLLSNDFAFRFPKGSKLLLQIHYGDEGNKGQTEKTTLDLIFGPKPQREIKFEILNNLAIKFPPNKVKTETVTFKTEDAISIIGAVPHLHFLCRKLEIFAITPQMNKIKILKINDWDYLWQGSYMMKNLVEIPAGSTIYMNAVFDNTTGNPRQPNNPIREVKYDTYSNEEMMVLCLFTTPFKQGDKLLEPVKILR